MSKSLTSISEECEARRAGMMRRLLALREEHERLQAIPTTPKYRLASLRLAIRTIRDELLTGAWRDNEPIE